MARSSGGKRVLLLSFLIPAVCLNGVGPIRSLSAATDPMTLIPSESLFCVNINNLNGALGQIDMFLTGLFPMGVSMPVKAQLGQFLGSPEPQGINMSGSFAVFAPLPGGDAPDPTRVGILVPVSSYEQFVSGNPNVKPSDTPGIATITSEGGPPLVATQIGDCALLSTAGNQLAIAAMKASGLGGKPALASGLDAAELKKAKEAPLWVYANVQLAAKLFGPMIQGKLEEIETAMNMANQQEGQAVMAPAAAMDMYAGMLDKIMKETKFASLALMPSAGKIQASFSVGAVPDTDMAAMFQSSSKQPDKAFRGYLDNGAVMNFYGVVDSAAWNKMNEFYMELLGSLGGEEASAEEMAALKKMAKDATDALGETLAGSFSVNPQSKPPFSIKYVVGLKDAEKLYAVLDKASESLEDGPIAEFYKKMGVDLSFDLKRKAETYKGVSVDSISVGMDMSGAVPEGDQGAQMVKAMWGDGFHGRLAVVDDTLVYAIAQNPTPVIHELIDQVKAGGSGLTPSEVHSAMQLIPGAEKADFFATYNYLRLLQMVTAMMPMPMPSTPLPTQSNIAMAADSADGTLTVEVAVPKQHAQEVMMAFMQMQQQKMMKQQGQN
jgi:hypothetical protein